MSLNKVALVGANGNLGPSILNALLSAENFTVTVITRQNSKSRYPSTVHIARVSEDSQIPELAEALHGQDALIVAFPGSKADLQIRYANAAALAGVKRFVPADFSSCDPSSPRALELIPAYRAKQRVRQHLQTLAREGRLEWTSVVCGHFFDWGLTTGFLHFDLEKCKALIFDSGNIRFSATMTETIGETMVKVLRYSKQMKNRTLFIQSLCVTQNEVLRSLERVSGKNWEVTQIASEDYIMFTQAKLEENSNDAEAGKNMISVLGVIDANWEGKEDFANSMLGLKNEDLDEVVKKSTKGHL